MIKPTTLTFGEALAEEFLELVTVVGDCLAEALHYHRVTQAAPSGAMLQVAHEGLIGAVATVDELLRSKPRNAARPPVGCSGICEGAGCPGTERSLAPAMPVVGGRGVAESGPVGNSDMGPHFRRTCRQQEGANS